MLTSALVPEEVEDLAFFPTVVHGDKFAVSFCTKLDKLRSVELLLIELLADAVVTGLELPGLVVRATSLALIVAVCGTDTADNGTEVRVSNTAVGGAAVCATDTAGIGGIDGEISTHG